MVSLVILLINQLISKHCTIKKRSRFSFRRMCVVMMQKHTDMKHMQRTPFCTWPSAILCILLQNNGDKKNRLQVYIIKAVFFNYFSHTHLSLTSLPESINLRFRFSVQINSLCRFQMSLKRWQQWGRKPVACNGDSRQNYPFI